MSADVILVCGRVARKVSGDPASDLKILKALRIIFVILGLPYGEGVFPLTMEDVPLKKKRLRKRKEAAMKKCWILGSDADRVFFIARTKSLIELLSVKGVSVFEMTENELVELMKKKGW